MSIFQSHSEGVFLIFLNKENNNSRDIYHFYVHYRVYNYYSDRHKVIFRNDHIYISKQTLKYFILFY